MKTATLWLGLLCGAQVGLGLLPLVAQAADTQNPGPPVFLAAPPDSTPDKAAPAGGKPNTEEVKKLLKTMALSPGVDEIVKLKKAGVEESLQAAADPAQTDFYYFLNDPKTGKAYFAKNMAEFEALKQKYLQQ